MSGLVRVVIHWTAGGRLASMIDKEHYHFMVQQDLQVVTGKLPPEANISIIAGKPYAAHTKGMNTGSIGVSLCGMANAQPVPLEWGPAPITAPQVDAMCALIAQLCRKYSIKVSRKTVLTHAEVQQTLGAAQNGKWDIRCLPGDMAIRDALVVGDALRAKVQAHL